MQKLLVFQSLWAMERRHPDGVEPSLEDSIRRIAEAGFEGVSAHCLDRGAVARLGTLLRPHGLSMEGQCFPEAIDDLKPVLEIAAEFGVRHLAIQPKIRPRELGEAVAILEGWLRLAEEAGVTALIETHRGRMTNDLPFTLDLLDALPGLPILADLSHYVVGQEFELPPTGEQQAAIRRVLDNAMGFHGRIAGSGQVQVELFFPQHRLWVDQFAAWWDDGFRSWRRRAAADATLSFVCELGPRPYAITNADDEDTTDRWRESLAMRDMARAIWARSERAG